MICHITTRKEWETAITEGEHHQGYQPGFAPSSLSLEGFIHCSFPEQVAATGKRFYAGQTGLVLLWIDPARLTSELRVEGVTDHAEKFPHIYGPLNLDAVIQVTEFDPDQE